MVSDTEGDLGEELELEPLMEDPMYVALARATRSPTSPS